MLKTGTIVEWRNVPGVLFEITSQSTDPASFGRNIQETYHIRRLDRDPDNFNTRLVSRKSIKPVHPLKLLAMQVGENHPPGPKIVRDPRIMGGTPCIAGTRMPAYMILEFFADVLEDDDGEDAYEIISEELGITKQQVADCVAYAARYLRSLHP